MLGGMATVLTYLERVDKTGSPATAGFTLRGAKSSRPYYVEGPSPENLVAGIQEILGGTTYAASGNGKLNRTVPLADPQFPWCVAVSIDHIVGVGSGGIVTYNSDPTLEVPPVAQFPQYPGYFVAVSFENANFPVLQDTSITQYYALDGGTAPGTPGIYYPTNDNGTQQPQSFLFTNEWVRYTDFDFEDCEDYITAQAGQMAFCTNGSVANINAAAFPGSPRLYLPNQKYLLNWHAVPLRLLTSPNSYIERLGWKGRVNQNTLYWPGGPFQPGELLYEGVKHKLYTPPVQALVANPYSDNTNTFTTDKLCDLQFTFLRTRRYVPDPPTLSSVYTNPSRNVVVGAVDPGTGLFNGGHNALPSFLDRQFHFCLTSGSSSIFFGPTPVAGFASAPLELLFTDCDSMPSQSGPLTGGGYSYLNGGSGTGLGP